MLRPEGVWNSNQFSCWLECGAARCLVRHSRGARQELDPGDYEVSVQSEAQPDETKAENLTVSTMLIPRKVSLGEFWKLFAMRSQAGPWKTSCSATWIQNPEVLWFDRNASIFSVATFILFDVRMRNSSSHGRWKSPEFLLFLLCFTQGPGLSTHTKWENCQSAWLSSLNDGWRETKPDYYYFLLSFFFAWDNRGPKVKLALSFKSDTLARITAPLLPVVFVPHLKDPASINQIWWGLFFCSHSTACFDFPDLRFVATRCCSSICQSTRAIQGWPRSKGHLKRPQISRERPFPWKRWEMGESRGTAEKVNKIKEIKSGEIFPKVFDDTVGDEKQMFCQTGESSGHMTPQRSTCRSSAVPRR